MTFSGRHLIGAGWSEKITGKGEDAYPLAVSDSRRGVLAVFDGAGGAGSTLANVNGTQATEAYWASRLCRQLVRRWYLDGLGDSRSLAAESLKVELEAGFRDLASFAHGGRRLVGTLQKPWPTTMAATVYEQIDDNRLAVDCYWAGDSRCYLLSEGSGLHQLTRDHTRDVDALAQLVDDGPMVNYVSANGGFYIDHHRLTLAAPSVVITATDGCFGHVMAPAVFEYELVDSMIRADDFGSWLDDLTIRLSEAASDDMSISIAAVGYGRFEDMQSGFRSRHTVLAKDHVRPLISANEGGREQFVHERQASWTRYRDNYERFLSRPYRRRRAGTGPDEGAGP